MSEAQLVKNEDYGLMAQPLKKRPIFVTIGDMQIASINKENLALEEYQRPVDHKRIKTMREAWIEECGIIYVYEHRINKKFYYTIPDGQHRACANPSDAVTCILMNTERELLPVDIFLAVNRNSAKVTNDDMFWAEVYKKNSLALWMLDYLKETWDIVMVRQTTENKHGKFCFADLLFKQFNKLLSKHDEIIAKRHFETVCECMFDKFGTDVFRARSNCYKGYMSIWQGMIKLLEHFGWPESDFVIDKLKAAYPRYGYGPPDEVEIHTPHQLQSYGKKDFEYDQQTRAFYVLKRIWENA